MNVAVAGWADAGKTTVAGTLARVIAADGSDVLAIEDDPGSSLAVTLGLEAGVDTPALPEDLLRRVRTADGEDELELAKPPRVVVEDYGTAAPAGVTLLRLAEVGHETDDVVNSPRVTARKLLAGILEESAEATVIDAVAVVEHLPPEAIATVDVLVVVVEPYYKSLEAGRRTVELAADLGFPDVRVVANKVEDAEQRIDIREFYATSEIDIEAIVPYAEDVHRARQNGRSPIDVAPDSPGIQAISSVADRLLAIREP